MGEALVESNTDSISKKIFIRTSRLSLANTKGGARVGENLVAPKADFRPRILEFFFISMGRARHLLPFSAADILPLFAAASAFAAASFRFTALSLL